jgi:hypothetical protein
VNVYSYLREINICIVCCVVAAVMLPRRARANLPANNVALDSLEALLAVLLVMQYELATLRQAIPIAPVGYALVAATQGATICAIPAGGILASAVLRGAAKVAPPVSGISLMQWIGLKLDSFDDIGSPVEAADRLTYVEDKMNVIEVVYGDRVLYRTPLLKGEAQIWWRGVQTAHASAPSYLTWDVFVR